MQLNNNQVSFLMIHIFASLGSSWSLSYGSWIYNYPCNQCISQLTLWDRTQLRRGVLDTTLCDKVCQWLVAGLWFFPRGTPVSSTNKTDHHNITEILLKVALNTITLYLLHYLCSSYTGGVFVSRTLLITECSPFCSNIYHTAMTNVKHCILFY